MVHLFSRGSAKYCVTISGFVLEVNGTLIYWMIGINANRGLSEKTVILLINKLLELIKKYWYENIPRNDEVLNYAQFRVMAPNWVAG